MGTGSFPGVNLPGRGVYHPPPPSAEVKERVELYLYSPFGPSWPYLGWPLPLPIPMHHAHPRRLPHFEAVRSTGKGNIFAQLVFV